MNTTFMNSENKTSHPYMKVLNLTDKKGVVNLFQYQILVSITYRKIKMLYKNNITTRLGFSMLPHPLINYEIQKFYQNQPKL